MVDAEKEIEKLTERVAKINLQLEKLESMRKVENYEEKVQLCVCVCIAVYFNSDFIFLLSYCRCQLK